MAQLLLILIIGLPWLGALLVWLIGDRHERLQHGTAVLFSVAAGVAALVLLPSVTKETGLTIPVGGPFGDFTFVADGLGLLLAVVATVVGSLAVIFSVDYMKHEAQLSRYYALVLFFIGGMAGLVLTSNLLLMFVFWEITALCSYALISFHNDDPKAVRGGIKALIITQLGGIGLLAGALLLYSYSGSYDINALINNPALVSPKVLTFMAFGCLIAAAAKSAQFPFQTWLPDAMEAPTPISALIHAATMVNAGVYLLARFYPAFAGVPYWREAVMAVGMLSALLAALMAVVATDLKRVLAYSTVSQLGYMVYAVGAGSVVAGGFHLFNHAIFKALLFLTAGAIIHGVGTRDMRQMGGLGKKMPFARVMFIIGGLALMGLPIFNGFWSKELILEAGLTGGPVWMWVVMLIGAGLTALYTLRCYWMVFGGETRSELHVHNPGPAMKTALIPLAAGVLVSWLAVGWVAKMVTVETFATISAEALPMGEYLMEIITAPATYIAIAVILAGMALYWWRDKFSGAIKALKGLGWAAENSFGFEAINRGVVKVTQAAGEALRVTQSGLINWNIAYIVLGLVVVLGVLALGGK